MYHYSSTIKALLRLWAMVLLAAVTMVEAAFEARPGIRAAAMGYAHTAAVSDAYAVYWNPALLAGVSDMEMAGQYNKWMYSLLNNDLEQQFISLALPAGKWGTLGVNYGAFNSLQYYEQRYGLHYGVAFFRQRLYGGFGIEGLELGYRLDPYSVSDPFFAAYGQFARRLNTNLGLALDLHRHLRLAVTAHHLNRPNLALQTDQSAPLPLSGALGVSAHWAALQLATDLVWSEDRARPALRAGGEWQVAEPLRVQLGYGDRFLSGGLSVTALFYQWERQAFEEVFSRQVTTTRTVQVILEYAFRYPVGGLESDIGNQYIGFRITCGKVRNKERVKTERRNDALLPVSSERIRRVNTRFDDDRIETSPKERLSTPKADPSFESFRQSREQQKQRMDEHPAVEGSDLEALLEPLRTLFKDNVAEAEKYLRNVVVERPGVANGHLYLAAVLLASGHYKEAGESFEKALSIDASVGRYKKYFAPFTAK